MEERHRLPLGERLPLAEEHMLGEVEKDTVVTNEGQEGVDAGDREPLGDSKEEGDSEGVTVPLTVCVSEPVPQ